MVGRDPAQGFGQQVEPLLDVDPPEEEQHELPRQLGVFGLEHRARGQVVEECEIDAVGDEARPASRERCSASGRSSGRESACRHDARRRFLASTSAR